MPPKRPNAFDVSFPEEAVGAAASLNQPQDAPAVDAPPRSRGNAEVAARDGAGDTHHRLPVSSIVRTSKVWRLTPHTRRANARSTARPYNAAELSQPRNLEPSYVPIPEDVPEDANMVILREEAVEHAGAQGEKPVRALSDFAVFDPTRSYELIPLDALDSSTAKQRHFEAAGEVMPVFLNEEDEGQEDDLEDEDGDAARGHGVQRIRTSAIFRWMLDYTKMDDPLYIETQCSWYELRAPHKNYVHIHQHFYRLHRIAQIVISTAVESPNLSLAEFMQAHYDVRDRMLGQYIQAEDVQEAMPLIGTVLDGYDASLRERIVAVPFLATLIKQRDSTQREVLAPRPSVAPPRPVQQASLTGNLDLAVLRPENQNPTHVSALVDSLALGLFHEHLKVVGPRPKPLARGARTQRQKAMQIALAELANRFADEKTDVVFPARERLKDQYWKAVIIDGVRYEIGDCVIMRANRYHSRDPPKLPEKLSDLPEHAIVADYFWFAKIIFINQQKKALHVQWFEHACKTYLKEISDPHELFLWPSCDDIDVKNVLGKATVHRKCPADQELGPSEYICRFVYHEADGSFQDIDDKVSSMLQAIDPPENCPTCNVQEQDAAQQIPNMVTATCLKYGGYDYHPHDYVLYATLQGPACIGCIIQLPGCGIARPAGPANAQVTLTPLGRMSSVFKTTPLPSQLGIIDERELFLTKQSIKIPAELLLRPCTVIHATDVQDLQLWLTLSPHNFYVRFELPSLDSPWQQHVVLKRHHVLACDACLNQHNQEMQQLSSFPGTQKPLRTFDPFGGVGAFALAMEQVGVIKLTHAIEITPSAALTLRKNSPDTVVYNQCSNLVFQHAVKSHAGNLSADDGELCNLDDKTPLPKPPAPGDIDCIVAGFPCQPHSQLNMFRKANDRKTHLLLNLLSWVDFLRPKYCFFENVRGFLGYNLHARQAGKFRVEGGIKMGGLKFFIRALLAMGYQVRFALLQAAHYGAPQYRVRFFLIAALQGHPLPAFPQPTHDFPKQEALEIKFPDLPPLRPILTTNGTAPHQYVSIADAIGDLPQFDWENPRKIIPSAPVQPRRDGILTLKCDALHQPCGIAGPCPSGTVAYRYKTPRTSFQAKCRVKATSDLQHITRILPEATVERSTHQGYCGSVVNVALRPGADYRDLDRRLWEWQSTSAVSAMARNGYRPGMYGRVDENSWFHTTVTNVAPTAKQSYVIHPTNKRIYTVRELARSQGFPDWFVFYSVNNSVETLLRHIGNAVPWNVSEALARELRNAMLKKWLQDREDAITID
ncbi:S-adenosyl-L-methionine-dependent methyltransferase [Trametes polyzona]|nr:S-adenosyl-L-methionine-dependent methyltransferase [Trametes polyzona]